MAACTSMDVEESPNGGNGNGTDMGDSALVILALIAFAAVFLRGD